MSWFAAYMYLSFRSRTVHSLCLLRLRYCIDCGLVREVWRSVIGPGLGILVVLLTFRMSKSRCCRKHETLVEPRVLLLIRMSELCNSHVLYRVQARSCSRHPDCKAVIFVQALSSTIQSQANMSWPCQSLHPLTKFSKRAYPSHVS